MISVATAAAAKTVGTMTVRVSRTAGSAGAISVAYVTNDSQAVLYPGNSCCLSAAAGKDYTAVTGRLDWPDGDTADKLISIPVMNDAGSSSNRVFEITLSNVTGSAVILSPNVTATIANATTPATAGNAATTSGVATTQPGGGSIDAWSLICLLCCLLLPRLGRI
jgi:hypothetical protein